MKRIFDIIFAIVHLFLFSILLVTLYFLVKVNMGKPVILKQQRPGLYGMPFYVYKFRTMTNEKDEKGRLLEDSKRLTSFGGFLRKYSLDELPQLFNVLKGDMSVVGPRPLLMEYLPLYSEEQMKRHDVRPGITGWAQVNGRNDLSWEDKFKMDTWYVKHQSFKLDLKIIGMTIVKVLKAEGTAKKGHVSTEKFKGSIKKGV
ncbi:sugar transferase [Pseudalkalibacillus sp. SCS-8]|uniref:sugar transferase n=1 Tax=Pseudalkalibacillus nanhaiensis TaxID=3115291 RepID=UPI0032DB33FF